MVDINKPISPIPPPEGGWERVQSIKGYKQREKPLTPRQEPSKAHFVAIIFSLLNKIFTLTQKKKAKVANKQEIARDLSEFFDTLQTLTQNDHSHDPSFTQVLSLLWHNLQEDCNQLESSLGNNHPISVQFRLLLEEIDLYPPWEAHSLGFYLTQKAGIEWIPIPFMEILFALHVGAKKNPLNNTLEKWCTKTKEIKEAL